MKRKFQNTRKFTIRDFISENPSFAKSKTKFIIDYLYDLEDCSPKYWELLKTLSIEAYNGKRINAVISTLYRKYGNLLSKRRSLPDATFDSLFCDRIEYCIALGSVESFFYEFYRFYFKKYNIESLVSFAYTLPEDEKEMCKQLIYMSLEYYKSEKVGANVSRNQFSREDNYSYDIQPDKRRVLTIYELQPQSSFYDLFVYMAYNHKSFRSDKDRIAYLTSIYSIEELNYFLRSKNIIFSQKVERQLYNVIGHVNLDYKQEHLKDLLQEAVDSLSSYHTQKESKRPVNSVINEETFEKYIYRGHITDKKGVALEGKYKKIINSTNLSKIYRIIRKDKIWNDNYNLSLFFRCYFTDEILKSLLSKEFKLSDKRKEKIKHYADFTSFMDDEQRIKNILSKILHLPAPAVTVDPQAVIVENKESKEVAIKEKVTLDTVDNVIESLEQEEKIEDDEQIIPSNESESKNDEPLDGTMQSDIADINEATVLVDDADNTNNQDHTNILPVSNETNEEPTSAENGSTIDEDVTNEKTVEETIQLSDIVEVVYTENETPAKTTEQTVGTQKETEINYEEVELSAAAGNKERKQRKKSIRTAVDHEQVHVESKESGSKGEELVVEYEKERLRKLKMTEEQINSVRMVSKVSDDYGFDIMSLDKDGAPLYIEVKSTKRKTGNTDFFYSENEMLTAKELGDSYKVYLVFDVYGKNPVIRNIGNPTMKRQSVKIRPINYKVSVKFKK